MLAAKWRARGVWSSDILLLLITIATLLEVALGAPAGDLITALPGQPEVSFKQYSGYITVDEAHGRNLFYYFVESPADPLNKPVTLWLNGGPGCSSVGGGAFSELGPFYPNQTGNGLILNNYSWIQESNVIFLESPAGVGFSFSENISDYVTDDKLTAEDSFTFLLKWFDLYPEYNKSDFYITGESYAGHYVPQLALALLESNNRTDRLQIQLKGILVGNPVFDSVRDILVTPLEYAWGHGMISKNTHDIIEKECKFGPLLELPQNPVCRDAVLVAILNETTLGANKTYINSYNILQDVCVESTAQESSRLMNIVSQSLGFVVSYSDEQATDPCIEDQTYNYLNLEAVQSALHAKPTNWTLCSSITVYGTSNVTGFYALIAPVLAELVKANLRTWVYSGDADIAVPFIGTQETTNSLAEALNLTVTSNYQPWFEGQQVGGWAISWAPLSFITVRGGGHMVPASQPARGLQLFSSFIAGSSLPVTPVGQ